MSISNIIKALFGYSLHQNAKEELDVKAASCGDNQMNKTDIKLDDPLDDLTINDPKKYFMQNLQANILKGHGREHVVLLFLTMKEKKVGEAREFLRNYPVTDAYTQFEEAKAFRERRLPGGVVRLVFLSQAGFDILGHGHKFTNFSTFSGGMANDKAVLDNGSTESWQFELNGKLNKDKKPVHIMLLVAYHDEIDLARMVGNMVEDFEEESSPFEIVFTQEGRAYKNGDGEGVEHFGYVDGRSQPLMTRSGIEEERSKRRGGIDKYDPAAPLEQFILSDPLDPSGFGSFFVFRKLEQNVAGFKQAEDKLADLLGLQGEDRERAGAQAVGRFEDGTPVTLKGEEDGVPVINNFDYTADPDGARCPFHSHIRKSNPRGSSPGGLKFDKSVQMARRGITYGNRLQDPDSRKFIDKPSDGVGLLFMSYQASIEKQFQFMQTKWVNSESFPHPDAGVDPVIGQGGVNPQTWFPNYDSTQDKKQELFHGFVTLKGGEYFFTPSISGLKNL